VLLEWRKDTIFSRNGDFLYASTRLNGAKPLSPDTLWKDYILPAIAREYNGQKHRLAFFYAQPGNECSDNRRRSHGGLEL
jgi:hypothetical protein